MKNTILFVYVLLRLSLFGQTPFNDPHWELTDEWDFKTISWADFNNDWNIAPCVRALDHSSGNVEPQYYKSENVSLNPDGVHLTVKYQPIYDKLICYESDTYKLSDNVDNLRWSYYTSGWIETKQTFYKKYGYIEAKIKAPYGYNFFPAFWTFVGDGNYVPGISTASEIDVFEFVPGSQDEPLYPNNNNIVKTNVHLKYYPEFDLDRNVNIYAFNYTDFNVYGVEWTPSRITWYINNIPVRNLDNPGVHDLVKVIINLALNPWNWNNALTTYPADVIVEYVNFYDYKMDCSTLINECSYDFNIYDNMVKKEIIIGGLGCVNSLSGAQSIILRASDGITINGDFTVPLGCQIYLDANNCY